MSIFSRSIPHKNIIIFLFCLAVLSGPAISTLFDGVFTQFPDTKTYLGLFHFDFDQSPVRKYRIIVPFIARGLHFLFHGLFNKITPTHYTGDFSVVFSFFIVNITLMSMACTMVYHLCRKYGATILAAIIGLLTLLTNRYTIYSSATPLVDSLFFLVSVMVLLGIKTGNNKMIIWAIFLGPFAKESFIFFAPVIFFFSSIPRKRQVLYFILSGLLVFSFRYLYDRLNGVPATTGLSADIGHITGLGRGVPVAFSFYGLYKIFINVGVWLILPCFVWFSMKPERKVIAHKFERYVMAYLIAVFVQMVISISVERMFFLAMPVFAALTALCADVIFRKTGLLNRLQ